eukprot:1184276-Prorocentrum_minimum.AAC.3
MSSINVHASSFIRGRQRSNHTERWKSVNLTPNVGSMLLYRPGDTVVLEPGVPHVVCGVCIRWPLKIVGGSSLITETQLVCPGYVSEKLCHHLKIVTQNSHIRDTYELVEVDVSNEAPSIDRDPKEVAAWIAKMVTTSAREKSDDTMRKAPEGTVAA